MLELAPIDVAPLEMYSVEDFRNWLTAGYKDLARPDTRARAFAPLHLLVGHGDITTELKSVYDVLSGGAQILFRKGLADAISALPTEANAAPVLRALLHLAGRIKALEVLPKLTPQVGAGFFGMPERDEGRELFALAIDVVAGMAPASGTADSLRNLVGSVFFRPGYAPLALVALCRAEPERFTEHLSLLRRHFAKLHTAHGIGYAAITASRVAHYVPLNVMASSLKALELTVSVPDSDRWLADALFVGEESPLEINVQQNVMFLSRRGGEGRKAVQLPEGTGEAPEFRSQLQNPLLKIFESALERLPEDLRKPNEVPAVVSFTVQNDGLSPSVAVGRMDKRLSREKRARLDREVPWGIGKEERKLGKDKIEKEIDTLRTRLVEVLRDFPEIWGSCQQEIAEVEPISDISRVFRDWRKEDGLQALVSRLSECRSYETLRRYDHPLLEIEKLAAWLEEPEPDTEAIEQVVWTLLDGEGKPGASTIAGRLTEGLRSTFPELAELLENFVDKRTDSLAMMLRRRIFLTVEHLVAKLPGEQGKTHFKVTDLAWRAVLLDKARELSQAAGLAEQALKLAGSVRPGSNRFMWWSRLGDANRIVAKASGRAGHDGWRQCIDSYDRALEEAHSDRKTMVYLRQAEALADRLALFGANPPVDTALEMCSIADRGCESARKAAECAGNVAVGALFMEARLQASLALALRIGRPDQAVVAKQEFETTVEAILRLNPRHTGVIWLIWSFYDEKGDEDSAIRWLDRQVESLRKTRDPTNRKVADYLEFQAGVYMLDLGQQDEARQRFQIMLAETQPNNAEARRELFRIGLDSSQEHLAQQLYREARSQPPGSQDRKDRATEALKKNQPLVDADPGKKDAVPWTRHARLLLLMDEINDALGILDELRAKYPRDPYVWFHLGEAHYRKGVDYETGDQSNQAQENYEEATTAFEKAWEIENRVDTADRLAACWTRRKNVPKAKRMLLEAERLDPEDGRTKFSLGWAYYRDGELDQALRHWVDALQCFGEAEPPLPEREKTLARQTANAVVRFAEEPMATEVPLEHLGSSALRMLASAASSAGWNRSKIVESMGARLDSLPPHARGRVPHALRAHLLYLQLAEGNDAAYQWHKRWYEKLAEVDDRKLFFEYAASAKSAFRRAVLWFLAKNCMSDGSYCVPDMSAVVLDEQRWGRFLRVASTWGPQENYYQDAEAAWPTDQVSRDELWSVVRRLNTVLFRAALGEVGLDLTQPELAKSLEGAKKLPLEFEILPARELVPEAPASLLLQTDESSSRILLRGSMEVVKQHAESEVKKSWGISGNLLRRSFYDSAAVPETKVESLKFLASRNGSEVTINEHRGLDLTWPIWSQDADLPLLGEQFGSIRP